MSVGEIRMLKLNCGVTIEDRIRNVYTIHKGKYKIFINIRENEKKYCTLDML